MGCSLLGFSLETLEIFNIKELNGTVELVLGVFVLILGSGDSNSNLSWYVSNTVRPQESVERSITSNILSVHFLSGESLALSDGSWCSLLESNALESLVHVESVVSNSGLHLGTFTDHFLII